MPFGVVGQVGPRICSVDRGYTFILIICPGLLCMMATNLPPYLADIFHTVNVYNTKLCDHMKSLRN